MWRQKSSRLTLSLKLVLNQSESVSVAGRNERAGAAVEPLVVLICSQPGMADRLLAEHIDDGGGRCRVCSTGGQSGHYRWPCAIHYYAREARIRGEGACDSAAWAAVEDVG